MKFRSIFLAAAVSFVGQTNGAAQTVWSVGNGIWSTLANWSNGLPTSGATVLFDSGSVTSTVDAAYSMQYLEFAGGSTTLNGTGSLSVSGTVSYDGGTSVAIDVPIGGTGNLWLNGGSGTVTLNPGTGSNTFSGSTQVSFNATLTDGEANSLSPNSDLYVGGTSSIGTVNLGFNETVESIGDVVGGGGVINLSNGMVLTIGGSDSNAYSGIIAGNGSLVKSGLGTQTLSGANTYTGSTTIALNTGIQLGNGTTNGSINDTSSVSGAGSLAFDFSGTVTVPEILAGSLNVVQAAGTTVLSGNNTYTGTTTVNGGTLTAGSTHAFGGTGNSAVTVGSGGTLSLGGFNNQIGSLAGSGAVSLGSNTLTVGNASAGATVFSGTISGTGGLTVSGYVLDLTNANTYSGATTVNAGTLEADNSSGSAFGTGTLTINGGTLQIGNLDTHGAINGNAITDNGQVTIARTDTMSFGNSISGTGGIEIAGGGSGVVTLTGTNTYTGPTEVFNATLKPGSSSSLGSNSNVSLSNSTLNANGNNLTIGSLTSDGSSTVSLGSQSLTVTGSTNSNVNGPITGTGSLTVNGSGEFEVLGAVTYSGGTTIGPSGFFSLGVNSGPGASMVGNVVDNGTFQFAPYVSDNYTFPGTITGSGQVTIAGNGTVTLEAAGSNYTGITNVASATLSDGVAGAYSAASEIFVSSGATLNVNHNETISGLLNGTGGGAVNLGLSATLTSNGNGFVNDYVGIISGSGGINVSAGQQGFSGNNTYSGGTLVSGTGELWVGSNTALGTGTLTFNGTSTEMSPNANVTLANPVVLDSVLDNDDGGSFNLTLTGLVSGANEIEWCTIGTLTLTNSNSFTGGIDMREGQLALGSNTAAGSGNITLDSGTELYTNAGPGITRTLANSITFTGSSAALGNNDDNFLVLNGAMSGGGAVTYEGGSTGTLTLSPSSNSFNGSVDITSGTVYAANNNAFGSASSVTLSGGSTLNVENGVTVNRPLVFSGAPNTLAGSGLIASAFTAGSSTILSPSATAGGPATLTFTNGLTLATGAAIHFDIYNATGAAGTGFSLLSSTGGLNLTASSNTITFNIVSTNSTGGAANAINFNAATPYSWMFASSSTAITGFNALQFNLVASGFTNATSGGVFGVSEIGNNLYLNFTPVPEPSTWALMGLGISALVWVGLRRRNLARA